MYRKILYEDIDPNLPASLVLNFNLVGKKTFVAHSNFWSVYFQRDESEKSLQLLSSD